MDDWGKPTDNRALFVESNSGGELRARRVWRFVNVMWLTWLFFGTFLWFRGFDLAAWICFSDLLALTILNAWMWRRNCFGRIMNLNLISSAIGLFLVSLSDPSLEGTILFYPVSIVVASQLLGVRMAMVWFFVNLVVVSVFFWLTHGIYQTLQTTHFDELVLLLGVVTCIYFCCQQGEVFYQIRTSALLKLSRDLEAKSQTLEKLATTDGLTGLMNRFQFQERLRVEISNSVEHSKPLALFMIDMDGFKQINDTLGHPVGDLALKMVAERLQNSFGEALDIARLGGDEFCLIASNLDHIDHAESIAKRACQILDDRYTFADTEIAMSASVGYCICPKHCTSDSEALAFADTAMFHAKENRMGYTCYQREMTDRLVEYRTIQGKLALALSREEFFLVYQPQVDMGTGQIIGVETLLRWESEGSIISPVQFIPLLEKSGEILAVSNWVVHEACRQLSIWNRQGYDISVSLNVSALQFNDPHFYTNLLQSIEEFGIRPQSLDFEITEGHLIDDVSAAVEKLKMIKELGSSISIDDFGTGYSSLAYLRQFPIDRLKIDRSFVKDIPSSDDGLIASSIIMLAKTLGMRVLAEGVETDEQLHFLKNQDCDEYQGYYFSKPISAVEVGVLLAKSLSQTLSAADSVG